MCPLCVCRLFRWLINGHIKKAMVWSPDPCQLKECEQCAEMSRMESATRLSWLTPSLPSNNVAIWCGQFKGISPVQSIFQISFSQKEPCYGVWGEVQWGLFIRKHSGNHKRNPWIIKPADFDTHTHTHSKGCTGPPMALVASDCFAPKKGITRPGRVWRSQKELRIKPKPDI